MYTSNLESLILVVRADEVGLAAAQRWHWFHRGTPVLPPRPELIETIAGNWNSLTLSISASAVYVPRFPHVF